MAEVLQRIKGRLILSINDVPEIRATFEGFYLSPVALTYTVASGERVKANELIVSADDYDADQWLMQRKLI